MATVAGVVLALLAIGSALVSVLDLRESAVSLALGLAVEATLLGAVWWFAVRRYSAEWRSLGFHGPLSLARVRASLLAVGAALAIVAVYVGILHAIGQGQALPSSPLTEERETAIRALGAFLAVAVAPVAEEALFRGFVFGGLRGRLGFWRAGLVSAALFSLAHLEVATFVPILCIGVVLATVYARTGSLWYSVLAHLGYNSVVLALSWGV